MAELDVETLVQSAQTIGGDRLVELRLLKPGIAIGLWKVNISGPRSTFQAKRAT